MHQSAIDDTLLTFINTENLLHYNYCMLKEKVLLALRCIFVYFGCLQKALKMHNKYLNKTRGIRCFRLSFELIIMAYCYVYKTIIYVDSSMTYN